MLIQLHRHESKIHFYTKFQKKVLFLKHVSALLSIYLTRLILFDISSYCGLNVSAAKNIHILDLKLSKRSKLHPSAAPCRTNQTLRIPSESRCVSAQLADSEGTKQAFTLKGSRELNSFDMKLK